MIQISNEHQAYALLEGHRLNMGIMPGVFAELTDINAMIWQRFRNGSARHRACFRQINKLAKIATMINTDLYVGKGVIGGRVIQSDSEVYTLAEDHRWKIRISAVEMSRRIGIGATVYNTHVSGCANYARVVSTTGIGLLETVSEILMKPVYIKGNQDD